MFWNMNLPELVVIGIGMALLMLSQSLVTSKFNKFKNVSINKNITGYEAARLILEKQGLNNVQIDRVQSGGTLSDYYDPRSNSVHLSPTVYDGNSVVSVAVAAHEVGHAIQHAKSYSFIDMRNRILPLAIVSGNIGWFVIILSFFVSDFLFYPGIILLSITALFQLLTLPIEFDASRRAIVQLTELGIVDEDERSDVKEMLTAAALTYVAALVSSVLQIVRAIIIRNNRD